MEDSLKLSPFFTIGGFVYLIGFFFLPFLCEDDTTILCALKSVKDMPAHFWVVIVVVSYFVGLIAHNTIHWVHAHKPFIYLVKSLRPTITPEDIESSRPDAQLIFNDKQMCVNTLNTLYGAFALYRLLAWGLGFWALLGFWFAVKNCSILLLVVTIGCCILAFVFMFYAKQGLHHYESFRDALFTVLAKSEGEHEETEGED
jgi:hypothetical protein